MYQTKSQRIKPTLVAVIAGIAVHSTAYADSNSAEVSVSATVVGPVEREIKIVDSDTSTSKWERVHPDHQHIFDYIEPDRALYDFDRDDFSWLDYTSPTKKELDEETDAFYESLDRQATIKIDLFESLKNTVQKLFPQELTTSK